LQADPFWEPNATVLPIDASFQLELESNQIHLDPAGGSIDWISWTGNDSEADSSLTQDMGTSFWTSDLTTTTTSHQSTCSSIADHSPKSICISDNLSSSDLPPPASHSISSPQSKTALHQPHHDSSAKIKKRNLNTVAARRYRQKKVDQVKDLEAALKDTEIERDELKLKIARLEAENGILRGLVKGS